MAIILLYHRVSEDAKDPLSMTIPPRRFSTHLDVLRARFELVPLAQLLDQRADSQVALTFDDGYADILNHAVPMLAEKEVPATFFLISGYVMNGDGFWWERLRDVSFGEESGRHRPWESIAYDIRFRRLRNRNITFIDGKVRREHPGPSIDRRSLSRDEVLHLASARGFDFGSHSVWHQRLACIEPEDQAVEVRLSKQQLEGLLKRDVRYFAYPYGDRNSFTPLTEGLIEEAGYEYGFINHFTNDKWNRWRIPRLSVAPGWTSEVLVDKVRELIQPRLGRNQRRPRGGP